MHILTAWSGKEGLPVARRRQLDRAVAEVQGAHGVLLRWYAVGPLRPESADQVLEKYATARQPRLEEYGVPSGWQAVLAAGTESPVNLGPVGVGKNHQ